MDDATQRSLDYLDARQKDGESDFADDVKYSGLFLLIGGGLLLCVGALLWFVISLFL